MKLAKKKDQTPQVTDPQAVAAMQQSVDALKSKVKDKFLSKLTNKKKKDEGVSNRTLFGKEIVIKNSNFKGTFRVNKNAKKALKTVIYIDPQAKAIKFVSNKGDGGKLNVDSRPCDARFFEKEFYTVFKNILTDYAKSHASYAGKDATAILVLPDGFIASGCISIPSVSSSKRERLINVAIDSCYKNNSSVKVNYYPVVSNKQTTYYEISAINMDFYNILTTSCSGSNLFANIVTYAGNASVNALIANNNKLKNSNFIFADIKSDITRLCYVLSGNCMGSITLPFGHSILEGKNVVAENMLFDHSVAELAVLNAREKAKAKQLTMAAVTTEADENLAEGVEAFGGTADMSANNAVVYKTLPKKSPRTLPKFMQRPQPETEEDLIYENFRVFEKYILEYIQANKQYDFADTLSAVYVNMPAQYLPVLERLSAEVEENGIAFKPADFGKLDITAKENLEIYGGLVSANLNLQNNF